MKSQFPAKNLSSKAKSDWDGFKYAKDSQPASNLIATDLSRLGPPPSRHLQSLRWSGCSRFIINIQYMTNSTLVCPVKIVYGEKWSRKNIFEIPPCAHHAIFITEFVLLIKTPLFYEVNSFNRKW